MVVSSKLTKNPGRDAVSKTGELSLSKVEQMRQLRLSRELSRRERLGLPPLRPKNPNQAPDVDNPEGEKETALTGEEQGIETRNLLADGVIAKGFEHKNPTTTNAKNKKKAQKRTKKKKGAEPKLSAGENEEGDKNGAKTTIGKNFFPGSQLTVAMFALLLRSVFIPDIKIGSKTWLPSFEHLKFSGFCGAGMIDRFRRRVTYDCFTGNFILKVVTSSSVNFQIIIDVGRILQSRCYRCAKAIPLLDRASVERIEEYVIAIISLAKCGLCAESRDVDKFYHVFFELFRTGKETSYVERPISVIVFSRVVVSTVKNKLTSLMVTNTFKEHAMLTSFGDLKKHVFKDQGIQGSGGESTRIALSLEAGKEYDNRLQAYHSGTRVRLLQS